MSKLFKAIAREGGYCPAGSILGVFDNEYDADCVASEYDVEWYAVPVSEEGVTA